MATIEITKKQSITDDIPKDPTWDIVVRRIYGSDYLLNMTKEEVIALKERLNDMTL